MDLNDVRVLQWNAAVNRVAEISRLDLRER